MEKNIFALILATSLEFGVVFLKIPVEMMLTVFIC